MQDVPEKRVYRVFIPTVVLAISLAIIVVGRVTMRSVPLEWDVPSFGFPLQAFGYSGISSGERWIALAPLAIDLSVALVITLPLSYALMRRLRSGWAIVVGLVVAARLVPTVLMIVLGITHIQVWPHDWPVDCRTLWIGAPQARLDFTDLDDVCVVRSLELQEQL